MIFKDRKFPFPVLIGTLFFIIFVISFSILLFLSYYLNTSIIRTLTTKLTNAVSMSVVSETECYLKPVILFLDLTSKLMGDSKLINLNNTNLRAIFIETLRNHNQFSNIYIGLENGVYFMVSNGDSIKLKYINGKTRHETIFQVSDINTKSLIKDELKM